MFVKYGDGIHRSHHKAELIQFSGVESMADALCEAGDYLKTINKWLEDDIRLRLVK